MTVANVAVIGAGPAGIYAPDILSKSGLEVNIDLFERLSAPYGLVRHGVVPNHPHIKQVIVALYEILQRGDVRPLGNVEMGRDIMIEDFRDHYDAVIIVTGADHDAPSDIPGTELSESYGVADFASWYDGNPDYPRTWPLRAKLVAAVGVGNVALDVARVLAKHAEDMMTTEVPQNVAEGLAENPITDAHVFGRCGSAQVKFTPLELRELGRVPDVDVIVDEEDFDFDEGSEKTLRESNQQRQIVKTLTNYASIDPEEHTASRRIRIHLFQPPVEILADEKERAKASHTERTEFTGDGSVRGTELITTWPVEAVHRIVGYASSPIPGLSFDEEYHVVPNIEGRVVPSPDSLLEDVLLGTYATGWTKRGPVGLIGLTKPDVQQTIAHLVEGANGGCLYVETSEVSHEAMVVLLEERGVEYTTWQGWELLDAYECQLGEEYDELSEGRGMRERVEVVSRWMMTDISRGCKVGADPIGEMGEMGVPSAPERFEDYSGSGRCF